MKFCLKIAFSAVAASVLLAACQTSTPASRIEQHPAMYAMLSPEQQALVRQGKITEGMSPDAVMLAWGKPSSPPFQAQENGRTITRWYYMGYTPVTVMNNGFYAGGGPWGWYGGIYPSTSTAFVPKTEAYVEFENGKVTAWAKNMQN